MPGDEFRQAQLGRPVLATPRAWNDMLAAQRAAKQGAHDLSADLAESLPQADVVYVKNHSGTDLDRFDALVVGGPIVAPADNADEFKRRVTVLGVVNSPDAAGYPQGAPVVFLDAIPDGQIGRGVVSGVCVAKVQNPGGGGLEGLRFADFPASGGGLYLAPDGPVEVLYRDTATDLAIVRIGPPQKRTYAQLIFNTAAENFWAPYSAYEAYEVFWVPGVGWAHKPGGLLFGDLSGDFDNVLVEANGNVNVPVPSVVEVRPAARYNFLTANAAFQWVFWWPGALASGSGSGSTSGSGVGSGSGSGSGGGISRRALDTARGTGTATLAGVTVAGNTLLVVTAGNVTGGTTVTFNGISMTKAQGTGALELASIFYLYVPLTTTGNIVATFNAGGGGVNNDGAFCAVEVVGLALDVTDIGTGSNGASSDPGTGSAGTTSAAAEYAQACACMADVGGGGGWSGGYTSGQSVTFTVGGVTYTVSEGYKVLSSTGGIAANYTGSSPKPSSWAAVVESFR